MALVSCSGPQDMDSSLSPDQKARLTQKCTCRSITSKLNASPKMSSKLYGQQQVFKAWGSSTLPLLRGVQVTQAPGHTSEAHTQVCRPIWPVLWNFVLQLQRSEDVFLVTFWVTSTRNRCMYALLILRHLEWSWAPMNGSLNLTLWTLSRWDLFLPKAGAFWCNHVSTPLSRSSQMGIA